MNRRTLLQRASAAAAALWADAVADGAELFFPPDPVVVPPPTVPPEPVKLPLSGRNDISEAIRAWYVNRCPLITRLPWVPCERVDFQMYSVRSFSNGTAGTARTQYCQTFSMPVVVAKPDVNVQVLPDGIQSPFDFNMTCQLQNMIDEIETNIYYGVGGPQVSDGLGNVWPHMHGLRSILKTNNRRMAAELRPDGGYDFIRDTLQAARNSGGEPNLLVISTNMMMAFAVWGWPILRINIGQTVLGTNIVAFECPQLHGVKIIEAPLLRPYTAIALTSQEVYVRNKVNPMWRPGTTAGGLPCGDWYAEMAIEVVNEQHGAWLEAEAA